MASAFCTAGKKALLDAVASHTWKAALYTNAATIDASTPAYTTTGEVANGSGYTTGGVVLTGASTSSGSGTAWLDFDDAVWNAAFFTARYLLIYDASDSNRAYAVIDFGSDKVGQGGDFTYQMPPANASNAQLRI